jgi:hypothetical protein
MAGSSVCLPYTSFSQAFLIKKNLSLKQQRDISSLKLTQDSLSLCTSPPLHTTTVGPLLPSPFSTKLIKFNLVDLLNR